MKILIIDPYYSDFLNSFYLKNPKFKNKNYCEQKQTIFDKYFGTADFYSTNLIKLGHQAEDIISNCETLQKQWVKEHNLKLSNGFLNKLFGSSWEEKIIEKQIKKFKPDVIYCQNVYSPGANFLKKIKKYAKLTVAQAACKLPVDKKFFEPYDLIISSLPNIVARMKEYGKNSEYLPLAFEATILNKLKKINTPYDVTHIGGYSAIHNERNKILEKVADKIKIDFWGYGIDNLDKNSPILKNYYGEAWGLDMYNILYNSKITLTAHIKKVAKNYANNMTLYESTGTGTMLITDYKDNLGELFEIGKEIETYKTKEELLEKINYYLAHEDERKKIAEAGQKKTLKDHTYEIRIKELINILYKYL